MYRTPMKTNKRTQYKCLKCKHIKPGDYKMGPYGCTIECNAPNKCFNTEFNARDYYCQEYKGFNEMPESKVYDMKKKSEELLAAKEYKLYLKKYYTKEEAKKMLTTRKGRK